MLNKEVETILNDLGPKGLGWVIQMGATELFRNYMIQKFGWFTGNIIPHSQKHRCEKAWYRFYIDHGRLVNKIKIEDVLNETLTLADITSHLLSVSDAYIKQYGFDVLNPDKTKDLIHETLILEGF